MKWGKKEDRIKAVRGVVESVLGKPIGQATKLELSRTLNRTRYKHFVNKGFDGLF